MSASLKDSSSIYQRFVEFEESAAAIYLQFASHFSEDRPLTDFWLEMGMQEKQHAGLLQFCLADRLFAADLPDRTEIQKIGELFKRLEKQAAAPALSKEEAFTIAIELEASEIDGIYRHLTTPLHNSFYLLRRKIALCLNHADVVLKAAREFGVKNGAMKELAALRESCSDEWKGRKRLRSAS
jgi:hypothetical protein